MAWTALAHGVIHFFCKLYSHAKNKGRNRRILHFFGTPYVRQVGTDPKNDQNVFLNKNLGFPIPRF